MASCSRLASNTFLLLSIAKSHAKQSVTFWSFPLLFTFLGGDFRSSECPDALPSRIQNKQPLAIEVFWGRRQCGCCTRPASAGGRWPAISHCPYSGDCWPCDHLFEKGYRIGQAHRSTMKSSSDVALFSCRCRALVYLLSKGSVGLDQLHGLLL